MGGEVRNYFIQVKCLPDAYDLLKVMEGCDHALK